MSAYQIGKLATVSKADVPAGMRLCRVIYKQSAEEKKAGKEKQEAQGCFLPVVSEGFAASFNIAHPQVLIAAIESLQDAAVRAIWTESKRSPCDGDFAPDNLMKYFQVQGDRLTAKDIVEALKGDLGNRFVSFLGRQRGIDVTVPENLELLQGIKGNYLQFFQFAVTRKPCFASQAVKEKVSAVILAFMSELQDAGIENVIVEKALEKMLDAPIASVDIAGL